MKTSAEYELDDTTEITIADNPIGKLLLLITAVLTAICLYYFATEFSRPEPVSEKPRSEASSSPNK